MTSVLVNGPKLPSNTSMSFSALFLNSTLFHIFVHLPTSLDTLVQFLQLAFSKLVFVISSDINKEIPNDVPQEKHLIKSQKELTNAVSHELRNPIASLQFAIEVLEDEEDREKHARYVARMRNDMGRLDSLVEELLHYAKLDNFAKDINFESFNLLPLAISLVDDFELIANEKQIDLTLMDLVSSTGSINTIDSANTTRSSNTWNAVCDPHHIARALSNIINNACRYANNKVQVSIVTNAHSATLVEDDNGPGIPESERNNVFNIFTRLDRSRDRRTGGHGLGLAIVKRIMDLHNGSVEISTSPLGGARFTLHWNFESLEKTLN